VGSSSKGWVKQQNMARNGIYSLGKINCLLLLDCNRFAYTVDINAVLRYYVENDYIT
jgi:hypothetical protein